MSENVHPAHECERCGCDSTQSLHTDDGSDLRVCVRCDWVLGQEMTAQDKLVRELWRMSDETSSPRPEDVRSVIESDKPPPETYEITERSPMEDQEAFDRWLRITKAMTALHYEADDRPAAEPPGDADSGEAAGEDPGQMGWPEPGGDFGTGFGFN